MTPQEQSIIRRILAARRERKRVAAAMVRQEKEDEEIAAGEYKILCDDLRAEGIDPNSAVGIVISATIARARSMRSQREQPIDPECEIDKGWPNGW